MISPPICASSNPKLYNRPCSVRKLDRGLRTLFCVNDLPKQAAGKQLETLAEHLKALQQCSPGYFIATARSDQLEANPEL